MLQLFNFLDINNNELFDILKINTFYKYNVINNNFIYKILTINLSDITNITSDNLNDIRELKRLEISQNSYDSNVLTAIIKSANKLELGELKLISHEINTHMIKPANAINNLKKLFLTRFYINIEFVHNLTTLQLYSCKIDKCQNFNSLIELLNSSLPNLKSLCLKSIYFNGKTSEINNIYDIILNDIYINTLPNVNFEKYKNMCVNINLKQLKKLSLYHIKIPYINVENLINLEKLRICNTKLYKIDNLAKLTNLLILDIYHNKLINLELKNLTNLTKLNLLENNITELSNLNDLVSLKYLDVSHNKLIKQDNGQLYDISNLKNLVEINLSYNYLPGIIFNEVNTTKLTKLILHDNHIEELNLNCLTNLTYLNVGSNLLENIDLSNLIKLQHLDLSYNEFQKLDLKNITNLTKLYINGSSVEELSLNQSKKTIICDKECDIDYIKIFKESQISEKIVFMNDDVPNYINISGLTSLKNTKEKIQVLIKFE